MQVNKFLIKHIAGIQRAEKDLSPEKAGQRIKLNQDIIDSQFVRQAIKDKSFAPLMHIVGGSCRECGTPFEEKSLDNKIACYSMFVEICDCGVGPNEKRKRNNENHLILSRAGLPEKFFNAEFARLDYSRISPETQGSFEAVKLFIQHKFYETRGILFYGNPGTGKTLAGSLLFKHLAVYVKKRCLFSRMTKEIEELIKSEQEYVRRLKKYDVIFLDDIDKVGDIDQVHSYIKEKRFIIFDMIDVYGLKMIATANIKDKKELIEIYGAAIYSRIDGMCDDLSFFGVDYRPIEKGLR